MLSKLRRLLQLSVVIILIAAVIGVVYGRAVAGFFTFRYVFSASFVAGAMIILVSLVVLLVPSRFLVDFKFVDHSNFTSAIMEKKENKRRFAYEILYLGISVIITAAMLQLALSIIIP